jgi:D-sedoheptulose 7-phosphate isomerase
MYENFQSQSRQLQASLQDTSRWYEQISKTVDYIEQAFSQKKKVFVAGNGGSATLAQHFADEMVGRYRTNRPPLPVIALTADTAVLTCIGNDFGFEDVFSRQVEALGQAGDVLLVFSTSGKSPNLLRAVRQARQNKLITLAFTGSKSRMEDATYTVAAPSEDPPRIQELHLHAIHLICELFETPP